MITHLLKLCCRTVFLATLGVAEATQAQDPPSSDWPAIALADLRQIHATLLEAHPGVIDSQNPQFKDWLERGYAQARQLAAQAHSSRDALAVLHFYLSGFEDGHLWIVAPQQAPSRWAGWTLDMQGEEFRVGHTAAAWPVPLPPLGSTILSCDKKPIETLIRTEIAPYSDRRLHLKSSWSQLARFVTIDHGAYPVLDRRLPQSCIARLADGSQREFSLQWQAGGEQEVLLSQAAPPQSLRSLGQGRYWIHASNFTPSQAEHADLEALLEQIRKIDDARLVILDTRGNGGGNSLVGSQLLFALLGSSTADHASQESQAYALWRVSPLALSTLDDRLGSIEKNYGRDSEISRFILTLQALMQKAQALQEPWVRQPDASLDRLTEQEPSGARGFTGRLALITDSRCASACLDFADAVLKVPGTVHLGLPTSADTPYIDIGAKRLPSGAEFWLPLKVWRNRARGNNQAYEPRFIYNGDINDTAAVQRWALEQLEDASLRAQTP
ncbi:MAG TPA: S41 family peptidase [Pseudomonas sp.]|nr:S41 family peptidase [Pseudomonas sp.]